MYRDGTLKLDELVTREYDLGEITQGYEDMHAGVNIRGVSASRRTGSAKTPLSEVPN